MPDKHQWQHRYIAPLASGQAIPDIRPGGNIARCLMEIQDVVEDLKSDSNFTWTYPVRMPDGRPINTAKPGLYYSRSIREIQDTLDGLSGAVSAALVQSYSEHRQALGQSAYEYDETPGTGGDWVYRVPFPAPGQIIHTSRPGLQIAQSITEIQEYIDGIEIDPDLEAEMQTWLESYCTSFVDHVSGPLNGDQTDLLYFTLTSWRNAASITGSWASGDLARGFNALRWTTTGITGVNVRYQRNMGYSYRDVPFGELFATYAQDAKTDALADWPNGSTAFGNGSVCSCLGGSDGDDGIAHYSIKNTLITFTFQGAEGDLEEKLTECLFFVVGSKPHPDAIYEGFGLAEGLNEISATPQLDGTLQAQYGSLDQPTLAALPTTQRVAFYAAYGWAESLLVFDAVQKWDFTTA